MTEKERYCLHTDIVGNCFIVGDDCKFGMFDKLTRSQVIRVIDELNEQDMQIFLLKCVIQTITAESMDKNISHKRIMEIKKHWYDKLYGDVE